MTATAVAVVNPTAGTAPPALRRATLRELTERLEQIRATAHDYVVPTSLVQMGPNADAIDWGETASQAFEGDGSHWAPLNAYAHTQLAEKTGIPQKFYDKLRTEVPDLLATNVNRLVGLQADRRLIRVTEGHVRAILSDRYRVLDSYDLTVKVAERAIEHHATVLESSLTEKHMRIKVAVPNARERIGELSQAQIAAHKARLAERFNTHPADRDAWPQLDADYVVPGVLVSNSEVGAGAFKVEPFVYRLWCWNAAISEQSLAQVHVGARLQLGEVQWTDNTLRLNDEALWAQVGDVIDATFNPDTFHKLVEQFKGAKAVEIKKPVEVTEAVAVKLALSEERKTALTRYFAAEGDTLFGLVNGVTRLAQDFEDPDQQTEVERYAGKLLAEPKEILAVA
jgi:hypothetical protein